MTDIPAGWKPDPRGRHEYRYWDGTQWTDHVSDKGEVSQDPVADTAPPADVQGSAVFNPSTIQPVPTGESTPPPGAGATQAPAATPEPEPEPTVVQPDPVVAEPVATEPVVPQPAESTPEPVVTEPAPTGAATPPASSFPPGAGTSDPATTPAATTPSTAQTDAKAAAQHVLTGKNPEVATIISAAVPGSGHFYMGTDKVPVAAGLLVATLLALILSWMSFALFLVGFVIWLAAAAYALNDLRGGVRALETTSLPQNVVAILLIGAGALMIIALFLPWYNIHAGGISATGSGWRTQSLIDILLFVIGLASILAGAATLGLGPVSSGELPRAMPTIVAVGGAIAVLLCLFRLFVDGAGGLPSGVKVGRGFGLWFDLWAGLIIALANVGILRSLAKRT